MNKRELLSKAEDIAERVFSVSKKYLPTMARLCLISMYVEEVRRHVVYFGAYRDIIEKNLWSCGWLIATILVTLRLIVCLVIPCLLVLTRRHIGVACVCLSLHTVVHILFTLNISFFNWSFWLYHLSLFGGILLLWLVETRPDARSLFATLPALYDDGNDARRKKKSYMQFVGRLLCIAMYTTRFRWEWDMLPMSINILNSMLLFLVAIGYKTKLSALVLVVVLVCNNLVRYPFWLDSERATYYMYMFFQTMSLIGSLLFIVELGPGSVSVDELRSKKKW